MATSRATQKAGPTRWLLSFLLFLALFALAVSLLGYGWFSLSGAEEVKIETAAPTPAASVAPSQPASAPPSGAAGHAAEQQK